MIGVCSEVENDYNRCVGHAKAFAAVVDMNSGSKVCCTYQFCGFTGIHADADVDKNYGIFSQNAHRHFLEGGVNIYSGSSSADFNRSVPLAVRAEPSTVGAVSKFEDGGGTWGVSIDRTSTGTSINTELFRIGLNYNNAVTASNGYIGFFRGSGAHNGYLTFGSNNTERMRVDTTGCVGIGTTAPPEKLTVEGNVSASGNFLGVTGSLEALKLSGVVQLLGTDTDKFLVLDSSGNVDFRTGANVLSDIGGQASGVYVSDSWRSNR